MSDSKLFTPLKHIIAIKWVKIYGVKSLTDYLKDKSTILLVMYKKLNHRRNYLKGFEK